MSRSMGPLPRGTRWPSAVGAAACVAGLLALAARAPGAAQEHDVPVLASTSAVTDDAGRALAARVDAFYAEVTALRATVEQRYHHRVHARDVEARGILTVRRPDRLRLLYSDGRGLALEGSALRAVDPAGVGRVHEGELSGDALLDVLGVLAGTVRVIDAFDVRGLPSREEGDVLELRPRAPAARWDRALLLVAPEGAVTRLLVVDATGSWLRIRLRDVAYPRTIPAADLELGAPARAPVVTP